MPLDYSKTTKQHQNEKRSMNHQCDELTKGLAQSVTRRGALKKFGLGLAGIALASLGLANKAVAAVRCNSSYDCPDLGGLTLCCHGKCVNTDFDPRNCGACGNHCPAGKYSACIYGSCQYNF